MGWKKDAQELIGQFQDLDKYAKYADLGEFLEWVRHAGHQKIVEIVLTSDTNRYWCARELVRWRKDHVSHWILFLFASDFANSASTIVDSLFKKDIKPPGSVVYFLYGRGIELFLKAFLVACGDTSAGELRQAYGHNLSNLLTEARRRKLGRFVKLSNCEVNAVKILSLSYSDKQFEYPVLGGQFRPDHTVINNIVRRMESGLKQFCRIKTSEMAQD